MRSGIHRTVLSAALVVALATPAFAGPPLLCHPYDIGRARSLPWDGSGGWSSDRPDYRLGQLIADTESLLTPATPVIVRMETLRRAALYASRDRALAAQLLTRFVARANAATASGTPDALALLDAAYIAGAFRQIAQLEHNSGFRERARAARHALGDTDAYALIQRSIAARPDDAAIQFAAALIAADRDRGAYQRHAERARKGVTTDALLARNIDHVS
jgi:hypothetical protein